jgi:hypothetical protein
LPAVELGVGLIDRLTSEKFNPEISKRRVSQSRTAMLDEKSKDKKIVIDTAPAPYKD